MYTHLDFPLFAYPEAEKALAALTGAGKKAILVVYQTDEQHKNTELAFLENILQAAQLSPIAENIFLLPITADEALPLAALANGLEVEKILVFGGQLPQLGLRAQWPKYTPLKLASRWWLTADRLMQIQTERQAGKSEKASALWKALQTLFLQ